MSENTNKPLNRSNVSRHCLHCSYWQIGIGCIVIDLSACPYKPIIKLSYAQLLAIKHHILTTYDTTNPSLYQFKLLVESLQFKE